MPRIVHFEIPMDNADRATKFYSDVFGWQITKWDGPMPYWLVNTDNAKSGTSAGAPANGAPANTATNAQWPGINGGMLMRPEPGAGTVNTIDVPDIDAYLAKVVAAGGKIKMPKDLIPDVGYFAYCLDTEGNTFGVMQSVNPQPGM
ncbi:MAG: VOC family protein [Bacteroidota bacterium]|nr:VOC family protein [Bacteroidota bacterium]MDP4232852.1 VOC family protein [Bacteroidota bacterium]MDP4241896.1 VOC family protein [Bacteroidota bacterium]MDP4288221.1 VOC family protein [Bacteroidota bacterium]